MSQNSDSPAKASDMPILRKAKTVLRISYTLPFVLASLTGVTYGLTRTDNLLLGILIVSDVFVLSLFANLSNDYFDHRSGADKTRFASDDPEFREAAWKIMGNKVYWEGNSFDIGYLSERTGKVILAVLAALALGIGVPIILLGGWIVIPLGLVAFFLSYFYTAPPLNLGARGLGELDVLASFTCMSFFSYYVIEPVFDVEMLMISLAVGISVFMMRLVDEMTGYQAHVAASEKDLCVRLGLEGAVRLASYVLVVFYIVAAGLLLFSLTYFILFLTLISAFRIVRFLGDKQDRFRFVRPVFETLKVAVGTEILIILALSAQNVLTYL